MYQSFKASQTSSWIKKETETQNNDGGYEEVRTLASQMLAVDMTLAPIRQRRSKGFYSIWLSRSKFTT